MTATGELRRMLDEHGESWHKWPDEDSTTWQAYSNPHTATESMDGTLIVTGLTPEQAIAATLRELVDGLRYCANESHGHGRCSVRFVDGYVTHCPLYDVDSGTAKCEALMRELGIEVEG